MVTVMHAPAELRIVGPAAESRTVPIEVLVRTLNGLQQLVLIFASAAERRSVSERFRPPADLRRRYRLRCGIPREGSYALPLEVANEELQRQFDQPEHEVLPRVYEFIDASGKGDLDAVFDLLPDSKHRERAFVEIRAFAPKRGELWSGTLAVGDRLPVAFNGTVTRHIDQWMRSGITEEALATVTGELIQINFEDNQLSLRYPPTGREIECSYRPEIEESLLDARRGLIQVTGKFVLDGDGNPLRLSNVVEIQTVDLSPMMFDRIEHNGQSLAASPPLVFVPELDEESQQLFVVRDTALDLDVWAYTRDALAEELCEQLILAWNHYAKEEPTRLTKKAQQLRNVLRSRFTEV